MFFEIDESAGIPIYEQVVRQVKYAVADGVLRPGEMIPSVRDMAKRMRINPNTVARSYRQLQAEDVLETVRGTGLIVSAEAVDACREERTGLIRARLQQVLTEAWNSRIDRKQLRELVETELQQIEKLDRE